MAMRMQLESGAPARAVTALAGLGLGVVVSGLVGLLGCAEPPSPRTSVGLRPS